MAGNTIRGGTERGGCTPAPWPYGARLSAQRAFVVTFTTGGARRRRFAGRVEHLPSGQVARFSSLKGLLTFFAAMLDAAAREDAAREERLDVQGRVKQDRRESGES